MNENEDSSSFLTINKLELPSAILSYRSGYFVTDIIKATMTSSCANHFDDFPYAWEGLLYKAISLLFHSIRPHFTSKLVMASVNLIQFVNY
jgi:hypothetical protein